MICGALVSTTTGTFDWLAQEPQDSAAATARSLNANFIIFPSCRRHSAYFRDLKFEWPVDQAQFWHLWLSQFHHLLGQYSKVPTATTKFVLHNLPSILSC
jgi:hypothetical protein